MEISEEQWILLLTILQPYTLGLVRRSHLSAWRNQELDVALDILYTAIRKIVEYMRLAEQKGTAIGSLERLAFKTTKNQFLDTWRKDRRLVKGEEILNACEASSSTSEGDELAELVLERIYQKSLFLQVAKMVTRFPTKLQLAMLIEFATRCMKYGDFDDCPLKQAFDEIGIQLEDYLSCMPNTPEMRSRQASLASLGYKRIAQEIVR